VGREQKMKFTESPRGWVTKVGGITWPGTIAPLHTPRFRSRPFVCIQFELRLSLPAVVGQNPTIATQFPPRDALLTSEDGGNGAVKRGLPLLRHWEKVQCIYY